MEGEIDAGVFHRGLPNLRFPKKGAAFLRVPIIRGFAALQNSLKRS